MRRLILGDGIMLFDIKKNKKFPFLHISKESLFGILFEFIIIGILGFIFRIYYSKKLRRPWILMWSIYSYLWILYCSYMLNESIS